MQPLLFILCVCHAFAQIPDADLPGYVSPMENIAAGSWVIPMDSTLNPAGTSFNIKVYGLVNTLLYANIPVKWAIKAPKAHNDVDFSASVWKLFPTDEKLTKPATFVSFKSGPFIVPAFFVDPLNTNPNAPGQNALSIARTYIGTSLISVYQLSVATMIPIRVTINKKPYVAVLDSSKNSQIQTTLLANAGFKNGTHYRIMSKEQAVAIAETQCITLATEPHFESMSESDATYILYANTYVAAMRKFVRSGGNFLAQCAGISSYENCNNVYSGSGTKYTTDRTKLQNQDRCPDGFFLTKDGGFALDVPNLAQSSVPARNLAPETPYGQYDGDWDTIGGSVKYMSLFNTIYRDSTDVNTGNSSLRPETRAHFVIADAQTTRSIPNYGIYYAAHGKLQQYQGKFGGNVYMLAGHSYAVGQAGARLYLNAVLTPAKRDGICGFDIQPCSWGNFKREFTANVYIRDPKMSNGGLISATLSYSWNNSFVGFQFGINVSETYLYNQKRGSDGFTDQQILLRSSDCCSINKLMTNMPVLFPCPDEWTFDSYQITAPVGDAPSRNCTKYVRRVQYEGESIDYILVNENPGSENGNLCGFKTISGREVIFRTYTQTTSTAIRQIIPQNNSACVCKTQIDLAIVIDRRSTITTSNFLLEKIFVGTIASRMGVSPSQVAVTFVTYNSNAAVALRLREGISSAAVSAAVSGLICDRTCPAAACNCGNASVSSGIRAAADELKTSVRPYATKVMVVITSNYHDTRYSATPVANPASLSCYAQCSNFRVGTDLWETCAAPLKAACRADLQAAVDYAGAQLAPVGGVQMYAVGVDNYDFEELQIISNRSPLRLFSAITWDQLATMAVDISAQTCNEGQTQCDDTCCGLCLCATCLPPNLCLDTLQCTNESLVAGCCVAPPVVCDVATANTNKCRVGTCSEATGCVYTNLTCREENDCYRYVCNPQKGLPCDAIQKWEEDPCLITTCDASTFTVVKTPKCTNSSVCTLTTCSPLTGECITTNRVSPISDRCLLVTCNNSAQSEADLWNSVEIPGCRSCPINCTSCQICTNETGTYACKNKTCTDVPCYRTTFNESEATCCTLEFTCSDTDLCTSDRCENGTCVNARVECDDGNRCTADSCDPLTGRCVFVPQNTCKDTSDCTIDTCSDELQTCVFSDNSAACNVSGDKCKNFFCLAAGGCSYSNVSCVDDDLCTTDTCDPEAGCRHVLRVCTVAESPSPRRCEIASCNASSGNCTFREFRCDDSTVIIAATVTTAAIVGIVIAAILICAAVGGGGAYAFTKMNIEADAAVKNNPLYEDQGKGGENPLHDVGKA